MSRDTELLTEIRDLLQLIAEPALEKRDANRRAALRKVVGNGEKKAKAVVLMDGTRSQTTIAKEAGTDTGTVSKLVKALAAEGLISTDEKHPALVIRIPSSFFDKDNAGDQ